MLTNVMCDLAGIHQTSGSVDKIWRFIYEANKGGGDYPAATTKPRLPSVSYMAWLWLESKTL